MECKAEKILTDTWKIEDRGVRMFVLAGKEKALLVDSGMTGLDARAEAERVTNLPVELFNTHADPDHISGNRAFDSFYMHPAEAFLYHKMHHGTGKIIPVYEGDVLELGERKLEVLHVPGHTPGSVTLLDPLNRILIGGDPIQEDGDIFMFGMHRDMESYVLGLKHLWERSEEFDSIYPSHAKLPVAKDVIPKLIDGAEKILRGELAGEPKEFHGKTILSYDIGVDRLLCDMENGDREGKQ